MSSENSVFLEQENNSTALLNDILNQLKHIPNTTHIVNNIKHLNNICVPMIGAKSPATGYPIQSNGIEGFVPAPNFSESDKFLRGDGTWQPVITEITPLTSEPLTYPSNVSNTHAYLYMQPQNAGSVIEILKYNKNISFGRSPKDTYGTDGFETYTTLDIKQDGADCTDAGIIFKSSEVTGYSSTLLANLDGLKSHTYAKMPTVSGTLLTDSGFTVNGPVVSNAATTINNVLRINSDVNNWNQGIRIQYSKTSGFALIGLGVSDSASTVNDSWFIMSDRYSKDAANKNLFMIAYNGKKDSTNGSLYTNTDGNWNLTNSLKISNNLTAKNTKIVDGALNYSSDIVNNTVRNVANTIAINFQTGKASVDLITNDGGTADGPPVSRFKINALLIEPQAITGSDASGGGEIQLRARAGSTYGRIHISNIAGICNIWSTNNTNNKFTISSTAVTADNHSFSANSVKSTSGTVYFKEATTNLSVVTPTKTADGVKHISSSVPQSSTAETPVITSSNGVTASGSRYYRPIIVSHSAPNNSEGKNGDMWIQYS